MPYALSVARPMTSPVRSTSSSAPSAPIPADHGRRRRPPTGTTHWDDTLATNLTSHYLLAHELTPAMTTVGWGRIITIGSVLAAAGRHDLAGYISAKAGLGGLTRALAADCPAPEQELGRVFRTDQARTGTASDQDTQFQVTTVEPLPLDHLPVHSGRDPGKLSLHRAVARSWVAP